MPSKSSSARASANVDPLDGAFPAFGSYWGSDSRPRPQHYGWACVPQGDLQLSLDWAGGFLRRWGQGLCMELDLVMNEIDHCCNVSSLTFFSSRVWDSP